jgi:hypothetical protein
MVTKKKSITIKEELDDKLRKHNKIYGSTDSGVINIALEEYFNKLNKKKK